MAAVWFVLTVPTEQQQQKAKAQDRGKDKIEIENESKVTFQIPTRTVGLNEAFNNQQPDGDLTGELFIFQRLREIARKKQCDLATDLKRKNTSICFHLY